MPIRNVSTRVCVMIDVLNWCILAAAIGARWTLKTSSYTSCEDVQEAESTVTVPTSWHSHSNHKQRHINQQKTHTSWTRSHHRS